MASGARSAGESSVSAELWAEFEQGSRKACARMMTLAENNLELAADLRDKLAPSLGKALRIGITGPPGVGKSTLTSALALGLANSGHQVGVIAVDPSSPFTGGAFMGDRIRMDGLIGDPRVFVRSMASRKGHGGLSPATPLLADVLEGYGKDRVLIETVGVGQAELDVLDCADLVILVLQPSTGDAIQTLKAGIIEAADLIVVNKADLPGVETLQQSLRFLFSLGGPRRGKPVPPIVETSALQGTGIEKLVQTVEEHSSQHLAEGRPQARRQSRMASEIRSAIQQGLWERYSELTGSEEAIESAAAKLAKAAESPYPFIRDALSRVRIDIL